jgi:hypothetical protein
VELSLNVNRVRLLLLNRLRDLEDQRLGLRNVLLVPVDRDVRRFALALVDVNLRVGRLLDLVDRRARTAEDARNRATRYGELCLSFVLLLELEQLVVTQHVSRSAKFNELTSRSSDFAPATPFLPPLMRTSSALRTSRVRASPFSPWRGNVILTAYFSSRRIAHFPPCPMSAAWY